MLRAREALSEAEIRNHLRRQGQIHSILGCTLVLIFLSCSASRPNPSDTAHVREQTSIAFENTAEIWRIEWLNPPEEACAPKGEESQTCPCDGFAYAEYGQADLVRTRDGREIDRFHLTPLFEDQEKPVDDVAAVIQRWAVDDDKDFFSTNPPSAEFIRKRPSVKVMNIADYNHDGSASEFIFQVGSTPCGHRQAVLVGITPDNPALHVFGTVKSPKKPLVLSPGAWEFLKGNPHHARYVSWACGDHGMDEQTELVMSIEDKGIRVIQETFKCTAHDKRGKRVGRIEL